eukprot:2030795-Pyramimonas_sp.AAC.1
MISRRNHKLYNHENEHDYRTRAAYTNYSDGQNVTAVGHAVKRTDYLQVDILVLGVCDQDVLLRPDADSLLRISMVPLVKHPANANSNPLLSLRRGHSLGAYPR